MKTISLYMLVAVASIFMVSVAIAETYPEGMVSYWKFNDGSGTTAPDSFGANNGNIIGAEWTDGIVDSALRFDGVHNRVEIPYDVTLKPNGMFSVEAWIFFQSANQSRSIIGNCGLIGWQIGYMPLTDWLTWVVGLNYYWQFPPPTWGWYSLGGPLPSLNQWHHIVATYKEVGGGVAHSATYLDGIKTDDFLGNYLTQAQNPDMTLYIGNSDYWWAGIYGFIGKK